MPKSFQDLSEEFKTGFKAKCQQVGLTPEHIASFQAAIAKPGPTIISTRPERGNVPLMNLAVPNVQELKRLGGFPDSVYISGRYSDAAITYPPPLAPGATHLLSECGDDLCRLEAELGPKVRKDVEVAMRAFVQGNSTKVVEYEPLINALHFPMQTAVAGGEVIDITAESPLIIDNPDGPVELVFAAMNIFDGGFIEVKTPAQIDSQLVLKES